MWYCNSLKFRCVTCLVLATEFALAIVACFRVRGEPCCEAGCICSSSLLEWAGIERKHLKFVLYQYFRGDFYNTVPFRFPLSAFLRKIDLLIVGIMAFKARCQYFFSLKTCEQQNLSYTGFSERNISLPPSSAISDICVSWTCAIPARWQYNLWKRW